MAGFPEYDRYDGLGLAELVRTKQVSPLELVDEAILRIDALNPALNAVVVPMFDRAVAAAANALPEGPFCGVPFLLKDLVGTFQGVPTGCGNRILRGVPWPRDSEIVRRLKAAGLIVVGKTNTPEFGLTPYTEPAIFGPTRNPWDLGLSPGGSSGGSAAAVAARMVPMASGGDGGGSIRIPASCCGVFGMKVSRGRTPLGPEVGELWNGLVSEHALTRSVRDSAALLDVIAGADVGAPYAAPPAAGPFVDEVGRDPGRLRIAYTVAPLIGPSRTVVHPDCRAGLDATVRLLGELGHDLVEDQPSVDGEACARAFFTVLAAQTRAAIEWASRLVGRAPMATDFEPATFALGLIGRATPASEYATALEVLHAAGRDVGRFFERYDVLLTPVLAGPPLPIGALQPTRFERGAMRVVNALGAGWLLRLLRTAEPLAARTFEAFPYTPLFNATGQPAMSVPLHWNDAGLPIGMQFVGRFGDEATLFRLAGQLERARPWADRKPPLEGVRADAPREALPTPEIAPLITARAAR